MRDYRAGILFAYRDHWCWMLCVVCLALLGGCAVRSVVDPDATLTQPSVVDRVHDTLQHGDWLVTRGVHNTDNFIATVTNSPLSHAGIYDAHNNEVIEAEGSGVHATSLADFIAKSQRVVVIRPMWASEINSAQAVVLSRSWVGKGYNLTGLAGLNMPDRYYCTQLVIAAYKPAMAEKPGNPIPLVIKPSQMYHWGRIIFDSGP